MRIETLQEPYIPALVEIEKACFGDSAWTYEGFLSELNGAYSLCLCAVEGESVLGCICMNIAAEQGFVSITVYPVVKYGMIIPEIAWMIQEKVKKDVERFTGLTVESVDVYVCGVEEVS